MQAFSGSWDAMILEPLASAILVAFHIISALGILTAGQHATMSIPIMAQAYRRELHTLFPSPRYTSFLPRNPPSFSLIVTMSARAWQGCSRLSRPLMTGQVAYSPNLSIIL